MGTNTSPRHGLKALAITRQAISQTELDLETWDSWFCEGIVEDPTSLDLKFGLILTNFHSLTL